MDNYKERLAQINKEIESADNAEALAIEASIIKSELLGECSAKLDKAQAVLKELLENLKR